MLMERKLWLDKTQFLFFEGTTHSELRARSWLWLGSRGQSSPWQPVLMSPCGLGMVVGQAACEDGAHCPASHLLTCQSLHADVGLVLGWVSRAWRHVTGTCPLGPSWGHADVCSGARALDVSCMGPCCWQSLAHPPGCSLAPQPHCRLPSVKCQTVDLWLPCGTPQKSKELVWVRGWRPLRDYKGKRGLYIRARNMTVIMRCHSIDNKRKGRLLIY